jgi:hypothetical protein
MAGSLLSIDGCWAKAGPASIASKIAPMPSRFMTSAPDFSLL